MGVQHRAEYSDGGEEAVSRFLGCLQAGIGGWDRQGDGVSHVGFWVSVGAIKGGRAAKQPARGARLICSIWDGVHVTGEKPRSEPEWQEGIQEGPEDGRKEMSHPKPSGLVARSSAWTSDAAFQVECGHEVCFLPSTKCSKRNSIKPNPHETHVQRRKLLRDTHSMICLASFSETSSLFGSRSIFSSVSCRLDSSSSS